MSLSGSRGVTLIEMLVVLLIMGLLVSVTVLSTGIVTGGSDSSRQAEQLAEEISVLIEHAGTQALVRGEPLGLSIDGDGGSQRMNWWRWSSNLPDTTQNQPGNAVWQRVPGLMPSPELPENLRMYWKNGGNGVSTTQPSLLFLPGREYQPFEIELRSRSGQLMARVWADSDSSVQWSLM